MSEDVEHLRKRLKRQIENLPPIQKDVERILEQMRTLEARKLRNPARWEVENLVQKWFRVGMESATDSNVAKNPHLVELRGLSQDLPAGPTLLTLLNSLAKEVVEGKMMLQDQLQTAFQYGRASTHLPAARK